MASFHMSGLDELLKGLTGLEEDLDDVEYEMVSEAAEIMDEELKKSIMKSTTKYGTGTLAESIHHNGPTRNVWGYFAVSTARGTDMRRGRAPKISHAAYNKRTGAYVGHRTSNGKNAVRNHDKLYWLEYGNAHQAPNPVVQKAVNEAEPKVLEKMQEVYNRRLKG